MTSRAEARKGFNEETRLTLLEHDVDAIQEVVEEFSRRMTAMYRVLVTASVTFVTTLFFVILDVILRLR